MALETSLRSMGLHLREQLDIARTELIVASDGSVAFEEAVYGEPRVIANWPTLSIQPTEMVRTLREGATRKFRLEFHIDLILYHGVVADTLSIQSETHERIEVIDAWFATDYKWNFIDDTDSTKDKVIFGMVSLVDHPIVVAPENELWSASRLQLEALSEEVF